MLFDSSLRKELARSFGATLVVLVTVVMTMMLIRTLGQASRGNVSPSDVVLVMGFTVLGHLPTILGLTLFVSIVGSLSRMYRDSEMVIWFSSGRGLVSFLPPMLRFSWPVVAVIALLATLVWPWSNQQIQHMRSQYEQRSDIDRIAPGEFQESSDGSRVFFIDKVTPGAESASNVFIVNTEPSAESVTSARSARLQVEDGRRMVILTDGQRVETQVNAPGVKISEFKEYGLQVGTSAAGGEQATAVRSLHTHLLWNSPEPTHQAELSWRLGLPLAALNFIVLGLAIASVNPRAGNSSSLMMALFAFIVYYNFITLGESWVGAGRIGALAFMALLHGGTLLCALAVLLARHHRWSVRVLWARKNRVTAL